MILLEFDSPFFNFGGVDAGAWEIVLTLLAVVAIIAVPLIAISIVNARRSGEKFVMTTRDITYAAVCLALSYALSFFGFSMPMGGTVTPASILPVAVFCYFFGFRKGSIVCSVYMLLQLTQKPYIVNAWSMLLDYLIPYFALSLIGTFAYNPKRGMNSGNGAKRVFSAHWGFFAGMLIYITVRYFSHVLSGVLFWDYSADYGMATWPYSLAYNSFCLVDTAIAAAAGILLFTSRAFEKTMFDAVKNRRGARSLQQSADGGMSAEIDRLDDAYPAAKND